MGHLSLMHRVHEPRRCLLCRRLRERVLVRHLLVKSLGRRSPSAQEAEGALGMHLVVGGCPRLRALIPGQVVGKLVRCPEPKRLRLRVAVVRRVPQRNGRNRRASAWGAFDLGRTRKRPGVAGHSACKHLGGALP